MVPKLRTILQYARIETSTTCDIQTVIEHVKYIVLDQEQVVDEHSHE